MMMMMVDDDDAALLLLLLLQALVIIIIVHLQSIIIIIVIIISSSSLSSSSSSSSSSSYCMHVILASIVGRGPWQHASGDEADDVQGALLCVHSPTPKKTTAATAQLPGATSTPAIKGTYA